MPNAGWIFRTFDDSYLNDRTLVSQIVPPTDRNSLAERGSPTEVHVRLRLPSSPSAKLKTAAKWASAAEVAKTSNRAPAEVEGAFDEQQDGPKEAAWLLNNWSPESRVRSLRLPQRSARAFLLRIRVAFGFDSHPAQKLYVLARDRRARIGRHDRFKTGFQNLVDQKL